MIDSHCHLDDRKFGESQGGYIREAQDAGVETIINIGINVESSRRSILMADDYDAVYATVGVHPHDAKTLDDDEFEELTALVQMKKVVAVGEIGLDYYRDLSPRDVQKKAFERQLELAVEVKKPIVIHTRESFDDTLAIVKRFASRLIGGVFHCFPGDIDDAKKVFDLGFIVSVGGVITFKNSGMSRLAAELPLDKVILETDAPYLTPEPHRGETNQPAHVKHVYHKMAELQEQPFSEVEKQVDRTCKKLFRLEETFGG